ncbi:hypothetical protein SAMN05216259_111260 [Actinacidiphila guanduensis]|uniref:Uncharacterized protein n=1 Tax=Actinacidiphila guanduensis TaxID=310781 RepID=A0A1H0LMV4_9ACTN|nr:hypothetical protein SAMN05216259_111260 [Actinacidiphila guanduensis]
MGRPELPGHPGVAGAQVGWGVGDLGARMGRERAGESLPDGSGR